MTNSEAIKQLKERYDIGQKEYLNFIPQYIESLKLAMDGLGDYSRNGGYVSGDVTLTNETVAFNYDHDYFGQSFNRPMGMPLDETLIFSKKLEELLNDSEKM